MGWNMTRDRNHSGLSPAKVRVWGGFGCCLWLALSAGCGQSAAPVATKTQAEASAEAADECRDRLNAAMQRVAPESLAGQTRRDSVVNAVNSWMASCGEAEVRQLSISDQNAALLSEDALRTARASRFSENDVLYLRDCLLLKGLTESLWKQEAAAGDQALAERARVTRLFRHVIRNLALMPPGESRIPVGLYEAMLTGRGTVEDRIWAFSEGLRQRQVDALVLKAATPGAATGSLVETAEWLVLVISGNQTMLFDPLRGTPVPAAADTSAVVTEPAGLEVLQGLDRWKSGEVFVVGHPSSFAPRMLVLQQRMEAADTAVLYEELAGGTSEIRPFLERVRAATESLWPTDRIRIWPVVEQRVAALASLTEQQLEAYTLLMRPLDSPFERESIDVSKLLTDPNVDESKLSDDEKNALKAEAISKLLERSDALFGRPSRRLLQARVSQIAGNFELGMIQELQQIRIACLQEVVELEFVDEGKQAVGRIRLPETILSVQKSAVGDTLYWTAMSQVSRGDAGTAVQTLRNYRRQYPDEKMKFASLLLEAELLVEIGDVAGAAAVLKEAATDDNPERSRQEWMLARISSATAGATPATPVENPAAESPATPATPDAAAAGAATPDPAPVPADNGQSEKP
jgi:hypothetical protein